MGISGQGINCWKPLQQGERELLLCKECEALLNDRFEKPFQQNWKAASRQLETVSQLGHCDIKVPYTEFKLFQLSILFRASVSTLPSFSSTLLGPHESRIRTMLLTSDPGRQSEYPIIGFVVGDKQGNVVDRFVGVPMDARYGLHRIYGQVFGGVAWYISVSSHQNQDFCRLGMKASGNMTLYSTQLNEVPHATLAGILLRRKNL